MSEIAVRLSGVGKSYPVYRTAYSEVLATVGLRPSASNSETVIAIRDVSFEVSRGERIALIGRNGAGKSTLLKLISGTLQPTIGSVEVNGRVSALFDLGVGFHDEFTGYENMRSALRYNDLTSSQFEKHLSDVIAFCELGPYLHLPVKTYSSGMKARMFFAVASAVEANILIVDEVMGAGDAYFGVKSAARIAQLTAKGMTLLLVSHNLQQVRQMCARAIWIEHGEIKSDGPVERVISDYEAFVADLQRSPEVGRISSPVNSWLERQITLALTRIGSGEILLPIEGVQLDLETSDGRRLERETATCLRPWAVTFAITVPAGMAPLARPGLAVFTNDGRMVDICLGPPLPSPAIKATHRCRMCFEPLRLGPGSYALRPLLFKDSASSTATTLAIGNRSVALDVHFNDPGETSLFLHDAEWQVEAAQLTDAGPVMKIGPKQP